MLFVSENLLYAPMGKEDLHDLWAIRELPEVKRHLPVREAALSKQEFFAEVSHQMANTDNLHFAIYEQGTLGLVGFIFSYIYTGDEAALGIFFRREFWNRKYADEASLTVCEVFWNIGCKLINVCTSASNRPTIMLIKRLGFIETGRLWQAGDNDDMVMFAMRRSE